MIWFKKQREHAFTAISLLTSQHQCQVVTKHSIRKFRGLFPPSYL